MTLERMWAGWRSGYIDTVATREPPTSGEGCFLCRLAVDDPDGNQVITRGSTGYAVLNAFPYCSGHLMVVPNRHVGDLDELDEAELSELMHMVRDATTAVRKAYACDGVNLGMNLGRAAGAGVPGHLHMHVVPRWVGDTNFMTAVAEARVLPESLDTSWQKLRAAWPERV
jgi:ATP adenylyltransferase